MNIGSQPDPTSAPNVIKTMQGIARLHGVPAKQAAAFKLKDLDAINTYIREAITEYETTNRVLLRNRALLLIGFFGAFRRSELVSLTWEQVSFVSDGMIIKLSRSKTDQTGQGADCVIPFGNELRCPVRPRTTEAAFWGHFGIAMNYDAGSSSSSSIVSIV